VLSFSDGHLTEAGVREAVGLADDEAIGELIDAYLAGDAPAALDRVASLADAGRDMTQVASQAEAEARHRLLASASDPGAARRLATILRTVAEAAGAGAREGRSRLLLELLAVDGGPTSEPRVVAKPSPEPVRAATPPPAKAPTPIAPANAAGPPATREPERPRESTAIVASDVADLRAHWAEVVDRANPVLKPLLRECRPIARDGARLTIAFPEGRDFMRSRIAQRAPAIEALLTEMFGGAFAIECVASNLELEPLTVEEAIGDGAEDPEAKALLDGVLKITGGELVDAPEVR